MFGGGSAVVMQSISTSNQRFRQPHSSAVEAVSVGKRSTGDSVILSAARLENALQLELINSADLSNNVCSGDFVHRVCCDGLGSHKLIGAVLDPGNINCLYNNQPGAFHDYAWVYNACM